MMRWSWCSYSFSILYYRHSKKDLSNWQVYRATCQFQCDVNSPVFFFAFNNRRVKKLDIGVTSLWHERLQIKCSIRLTYRLQMLKLEFPTQRIFLYQCRWFNDCFAFNVISENSICFCITNAISTGLAGEKVKWRLFREATETLSVLFKRNFLILIENCVEKSAMQTSNLM